MKNTYIVVVRAKQITYVEKRIKVSAGDARAAQYAVEKMIFNGSPRLERGFEFADSDDSLSDMEVANVFLELRKGADCE